MKKGSDVIAFAKTLIGRPYVLGCVVPLEDANYTGPFDCSKFVGFANYQVLQSLYGVRNGTAFTGYFEEDAKLLGEMIPVSQAARIPGAMIIRYPAPGAYGHIIFSQGNGETCEANSTKYGCMESIITGRRFDTGILIPGINYSLGNPVNPVTPVVFKYEVPNMIDPFISKIQKALKIKADNEFGKKTLAAIIAYQTKKGLIVDGEVMPGGQTSKSLWIR